MTTAGNRLAWYKFWRLLGREAPTDNHAVRRDDAAWLCLYLRLLRHLPGVDPEAGDVLLLEMRKAIAFPELVAVADRRYCTWTGYTGWFDVLAAVPVAAAAVSPLETIAYDTGVLLRRHLEETLSDAADEPGTTRDQVTAGER